MTKNILKGKKVDLKKKILQELRDFYNNDIKCSYIRMIFNGYFLRYNSRDVRNVDS